MGQAAEENGKSQEPIGGRGESDAQIDPTQAKPGGTKVLGGLYKDCDEATSAVREEFLYWSEKVTDRSFELSLAVIAANWAAFGTTAKIVANSWSRLSVAFAVIAVGLSLFGAAYMTRLHRKRLMDAEKDPDSWAKEFDRTKGTKDPFPFTEEIATFGAFTRVLKIWMPLVSGGLFLAALVLS